MMCYSPHYLKECRLRAKYCSFGYCQVKSPIPARRPPPDIFSYAVWLYYRFIPIPNLPSIGQHRTTDTVPHIGRFDRCVERSYGLQDDSPLSNFQKILRAEYMKSCCGKGAIPGEKYPAIPDEVDIADARDPCAIMKV